jgi:hypothetical protein
MAGRSIPKLITSPVTKNPTQKNADRSRFIDESPIFGHEILLRRQICSSAAAQLETRPFPIQNPA